MTATAARPAARPASAAERAFEQGAAAVRGDEAVLTLLLSRLPVLDEIDDAVDRLGALAAAVTGAAAELTLLAETLLTRADALADHQPEPMPIDPTRSPRQKRSQPKDGP